MAWKVPRGSVAYSDPANNAQRGWMGAALGTIKARRDVPTNNPAALKRAARKQPQGGSANPSRWPSRRRGT